MINTHHSRRLSELSHGL